jgi:hypothetical protein
MGKPSLKVDQGLVRKLSTYFIRRPANMSARVHRSTDQLIDHDTYTIISFDSERWDTGANSTYTNGFWDAATPTRITATVSGFYIMTGHIVFGSNITGTRRIAIRHMTDALWIAFHSHPTVNGGSTAMSVATEYWLRVGDQVGLYVHQDSGVAINVSALDRYSPEFTITRVP